MEAMRAGTKSFDGVVWCDQLKNLCIRCMCVCARVRCTSKLWTDVCAHVFHVHSVPNVQSSIVADERVMSSFFYTVYTVFIVENITVFTDRTLQLILTRTLSMHAVRTARWATDASRQLNSFSIIWIGFAYLLDLCVWEWVRLAPLQLLLHKRVWRARDLFCVKNERKSILSSTRTEKRPKWTEQ